MEGGPQTRPPPGGHAAPPSVRPFWISVKHYEDYIHRRLPPDPRGCFVLPKPKNVMRAGNEKTNFMPGAFSFLAFENVAGAVRGVHPAAKPVFFWCPNPRNFFPRTSRRKDHSVLRTNPIDLPLPSNDEVKFPRPYTKALRPFVLRRADGNYGTRPLKGRPLKNPKAFTSLLPGPAQERLFEKTTYPAAATTEKSSQSQTLRPEKIHARSGFARRIRNAFQGGRMSGYRPSHQSPFAMLGVPFREFHWKSNSK